MVNYCKCDEKIVVHFKNNKRMGMTSIAFRLGGAVLVLFSSIILTSCTSPYATVSLKPYPDAEAESEIIEPDYPDIQAALKIIDSVLASHGYVTDPTRGNNTSIGWMFTKTYVHKRPYVHAVVYNIGIKKPTAMVKAGKRSIQVYVAFEEGMKWFSKMNPETVSVQDEIAQRLVNRFGKEKITVANGRQEFVLQ